MGRAGYNGGSPSVRAPKGDNVYIYAVQETLETELLLRARIVKSGEGLHNERGGVQREFGYLLCVSSTPAGEKATSLAKQLTRAWKGAKKKQSREETKWVAASDLLNKAPEGPELARKYHVENPEAPQPWGFEQLNRSSETSSDNSSGTGKDSQE
jgi:hypothetical protein